MGSRWWADEPHVPCRRQSLPHTDPKLPSIGDLYRIARKAVRPALEYLALMHQVDVHLPFTSNSIMHEVSRILPNIQYTHLNCFSGP